MIYLSTAKAYTNIALTKYWGKKDDYLNLATTSSIGLTLDKFFSQTTVKFSPEQTQDQLIINGQQMVSDKFNTYMNKLRDKYGFDLFVSADSTNNMPLAAGFASSASAYAAMALAINSALDFGLDSQELSEMARLGSGSASRSILGGLTLWDVDNGLTSQIQDPVGLDILIVDLMIEKQSKLISSGEGMKIAQTSPLYSKWVTDSVQQTKQMIEAINAGDLEQIGSIAEANALFMHELNRTSKQPFDYFNEKTIQTIEQIKDLRKQGVLAFATVDAGPNVKIITNSKNLPSIESAFNGVELIVQKPGPAGEIL